ncbi:MAG: hypothetical protein KJ574_01260 [Nanoarchaeota archaeon]|nr:hypothetical protein [Nanoarchaeota archaeon]
MKKSQITLFIMIGIVFVIITGIIIYLQGQKEKMPEAEIIAGRIPAELNPLKEYVDACIKDVSLEALQKVGLHGGYIDPLDSHYTDSPLEIDDLEPTEGDAILLNPGDRTTAIPYWWYLYSPNDCRDCYVTAKNFLRIDLVEEQINQYVDDHLGKCLKDFRNFESLGFRVTPEGDIRTKTTVTEKDVTMEVNYPLKVGIEDRETKVETFFIRQDLPFRDIYNLAREIVIGENVDGYLEQIMEHFIVLHSGFDTSMLPPHHATEKSFVKRIWVKQMAKDKIHEILKLYIPMININNTRGAKPVESSDILQSGPLRPLFRDVLINNYTDYEVTFLFLDWPIYVDINPNLGQILTTSNTISISFLLFGKQEYQEYEFYYDVSYPVIVQIRAPDVLNNRSYTFFFAMEGNLRGDKTIREYMENKGRIGPSRPLFRVDAGEEILQDENYQNTPGLGSTPAPKTVMCGKKQQIGSDIILNISSSSDVPLENAEVKFGCGRHSVCSIGTAMLDPLTNSTLFEGKAPICLNGGYVSVESMNHRTGVVQKLTSLPGQNISLDVVLDKYTILNVTVSKLQLQRIILERDDPDDYQGNYKTLLLPGIFTNSDIDDQFILNVERMEENAIVPEPKQTLIIDKKNPIPIMQQLKLLPGTYSITGFYFNNAGTVIPAEHRCANDGDDCYWVPEQPGLELEVMVAGGLEFNNESGYWYVSPTDLTSATEVDLRVLAFPAPLYVEDLSEGSMLPNLSMSMRSQLEPKIR